MNRTKYRSYLAEDLAGVSIDRSKIIVGRK
jgi:hypothetical protein